MSRNIKLILSVLGVAILLIGPIGAHVAHAQWSWVTDSIGTVVASLLMIPMMLSSWILSISGVLLNWVLDMTVVNMAKNIEGITGINIAWSVIRDLSNMVFIFSLLYVAIGTILGVSGADWKKTLTSIVIAAVLINFSLFMTKVIVDASNIVTIGFYRQIVPANDTVKLSDKIINSLRITTLYNPDVEGKLAKDFASSLGKIAIVSIGSSIFMLITAFNFLSVSLMFIIRYVTIIFLLIFSPVAIMNSVLPQLGGTASKWWKQLSGQAIFAPLYMILTWVVLTIINSKGLTQCEQGIGSLSGAFVGISGSQVQSVGSCDSVALIFNFIIISAFMIATLTIAKGASEQAGGQAAALVGTALGFGASAAAYGSRRTLGKAGQMASESKWLKDRAKDSRIVMGTLQLADKTAKGTFDVRNSRLAGAGKSLGLGDLGIGGKAGGKDGYSGMQKKSIEAYEKRGKLLEAADGKEKAVLKEEREAKQQAIQSKMDTLKTALDPKFAADEALIENDAKAIDTKITEMNNEGAVKLKDIDDQIESKRSQKILPVGGQAQLDREVTELEQKKKEQEQILKNEVEPLQKRKEEKAKALEEKKGERGAAQITLDKQNRGATKHLREKLEKIGWEDDSKEHLAEDGSSLEGDKLKKAKEKYKKDQEGKRKAYENGESRVTNYADRIEKPISIFRFNIPFTTSNSQRRAAEKLKKGKESVGDKLKKIMKENGDIPEEVTKKDAEPEKTPDKPITP